MPNPDIHLLLGEIKGKLEIVIDNQNNHGAKLDSVHGRLAKVESKAAISGSGAGGLVGAIAAIGVTLIKEKLGL